MLSAGSFYAGIFVGVHMDRTKTTQDEKDCWKEDDPRLVNVVKDQVNAKLREHQKQQQNQVHTTEEEGTLRIPQNGLGKIVTGMGRVSRDEFANKFDMGVPLDTSSSGNSEVLLFYNRKDALPSNPFEAQQAMTSREVPLFNSVEEATENCDNLHVILTDPSRTRQCVALMGQYESFHIQKWMRLPEDGKLDPKVPLRLVNRGAQSNGRKSTKPPTREQTLQHWGVLTTYLSSLSDVLDRLKPIVEKVAATHHNTVVVMVCNFGQSELLLNFICNAKAKGLDISSVLVFTTDLETQQLVDSLGMGVSTFYDETNFGRMPKEAARRYADNNFMAMMGAKVYCVQMVSMLGYDVLYQDVDVVWYQDPLPWFHNTTLSSHSDFDIYFQDDGNHALFYAPYSANTGFYYVRHNDKTQYFFNSLLLAGDLILSTHSHQITLIALLNEHASMYGLKVKILERNTLEFPGGFSFHNKKEFMKDLIQGHIQPYIFHMSWTVNKANKILYFRQMAEWYLNDKCVNKTLSEIVEGEGGSGITGDGCCAAAPIVSCHYRDKPSKIPCRDSPPIDKGRPSFW
jgi:hypothetical protein